MNKLSEFTLIIPTHNRADKFTCLINLLSKYKTVFHLIVLDSSENETKTKNKHALKRLLKPNVSYVYHEFSTSCEPFEKFYFGISRVKTKYCSLCADDDILFLENVEEIVAFLESHSEYIGAHGYYFNFQLDQDGFEVQDIVYSRNNLFEDERMKRVYALFSNYEATFYATYRTQIIKDFFLLSLTVDTALWKELILALASVVSGKICRLPFFYYGRRVGQSLPFNNWHPLEIFAKKPDLYFQDYFKCRAALFQHFDVNGAEEEKIFDLAHLLYLKNYIDPVQIEMFCNESFEESHSEKGVFYKSQKMKESIFKNIYKNRKGTHNKARLAISIALREILLNLGYKLVHRFNFLKPFMKKIAVYLIPNTIIHNTSQKSLSIPYNFGSEFFVRNLPSGHRPNKKDVDFIISNLENYVVLAEN